MKARRLWRYHPQADRPSNGSTRRSQRSIEHDRNKNQRHSFQPGAGGGISGPVDGREGASTGGLPATTWSNAIVARIRALVPCGGASGQNWRFTAPPPPPFRGSPPPPVGEDLEAANYHPNSLSFTTLPPCVSRMALPISSSRIGLPCSLSQNAEMKLSRLRANSAEASAGKCAGVLE